MAGWRRQYVENRLRNSGIDYTLFEKTDIQTIRELYACCNLYIVSSRYEGGPQSIIEASGMKVPIISTDVGIASNILSKNCIIDITKTAYTPNKEDIQHAYNNVMKLKIKKHGNKFIKLLSDIKNEKKSADNRN